MAMRNNVLLSGLYLIVLLFCNNVWSQTAGDEAKEMFNNAKERDQKAIDEAVNGWWTASMKTQQKRIEWWREAKFGMFIHWGIYSLPGGEWKGKKVSGYAEHLMRKEKITRDEYLQLAHQFDPVRFNADEWITNAKKAGMKYFIITAKHHDGFAMYNSIVSDFDLTDQSPFKRDPMAELAIAAKKQGIRFGFYYSHAFDWEHPDAPGNDWEFNNPGGDKLLGGTSWYDAHPDWLPKAQKYVREKAIPQIKELIAKYHPDILWFDTPQKLPLSENIYILKAIRETDPNIVINGRLVRSATVNFGDYKNTADRPAEFYPVPGDQGWEAIPTTNESYGYHKFDSSHKSIDHFIQLLAKAASRGGNLLMNIGPKGDGSFDKKDLNILNDIGQWMDKNGESIYGTMASPLPLQNWGVSTLKDDRIYLHVFKWPASGKLVAGGLRTAVKRAYMLASPKTNVQVKKINNKDIEINLGMKVTDTIDAVVVLELAGKPETDSVRYISSSVPGERLLAFDAKLSGKGFGFGDGKTNRYYVEGWKTTSQSVSWTFRVAERSQFQLVIRYVADENAGGTYRLSVDKTLPIDLTVAPVKNSTVISGNIGKPVIFGPGVHTIEMRALTIKKSELMKLLEIELIPVEN
jgi:alpha-L-fucosidase